MARFVVDCGVVLRLASEEIEVSVGHELLAPTLLRSQTLSALHEAVHRGDISAEVAQERLDRIQSTSIRLLGDAVLRRVAWRIADQLGWAETYDAEYLALRRRSRPDGSFQRAPQVGSRPMSVAAIEHEHRRSLGGAAHLRARLVECGPRGVALGARLLAAAVRRPARARAPRQGAGTRRPGAGAHVRG